MKEHSETESPRARGPSGQGVVPGSSPNSPSSKPVSKSIKENSLDDLAAIVQRVIAGELQADNSPDTAGRAAFRVCGKLRQPLSSLIGVVGFRSLFSRALTLAKEEVPWLEGITIRADGIIEFSQDMDAQLAEKEAARGGSALITQLLGLLIVFIGEALTLRLVHNLWPKAVASKSLSNENSHEKNT